VCKRRRALQGRQGATTPLGQFCVSPKRLQCATGRRSGTLAGHSSLGVAVTNQPIGSLPYNDTIEFEGSLEPFGTLAKSDSLTNFVTINQCGSLSYLCY